MLSSNFQQVICNSELCWVPRPSPPTCFSISSRHHEVLHNRSVEFILFPYSELRLSASTSLFLELPIDIILLVVEHLRQTPESILILALTCKTLRKLLIPSAPTLASPARDSLLILLEKDSGIGGQAYFCPICHALHSFSPSWGPLTYEHTLFNREYRYLRPCYADLCFSLRLERYRLGYHHARLVMNRHLHGAPCGLPLQNLDAASIPGLIVPQWRQTWSARVIENELFLCAIHTINSSGMSDRTLRSIIDRGYTYFICRHVDPSHQVAALKRATASSGETEELFSECRNTLGWCKICLTDYCTTIEQKRPRKKVWPGIWTQHQSASSGWTITIVAYHQLGPCRSPFDWKWGAITGSIRTKLGNWRIDHPYPPGSVREKWIVSL